MDVLSETRALTSGKYVPEQGVKVPDLSSNFLVALHRFRTIVSQMLYFQGFFTSKRTFGGYFYKKNTCTHFQKIYS